MSMSPPPANHLPNNTHTRTIQQHSSNYNTPPPSNRSSYIQNHTTQQHAHDSNNRHPNPNTNVNPSHHLRTSQSHPPLLDTTQIHHTPQQSNQPMHHNNNILSPLSSSSSTSSVHVLSPTQPHPLPHHTNMNMTHNSPYTPHHSQHPHPYSHPMQMHDNNISHPLHPLHSDYDNRSAVEREYDRELYMSRMQELWEYELESIQRIDFLRDKKQIMLPLARIKKIMKSDEDVRMISAEAPIVFAKACELFILDLTTKSWQQTFLNQRRTLNRNDVADALLQSDIFDFLVPVVPKTHIDESYMEEAEEWDFTTGMVHQDEDPSLTLYDTQNEYSHDTTNTNTPQHSPSMHPSHPSNPYNQPPPMSLHQHRGSQHHIPPQHHIQQQHHHSHSARSSPHPLSLQQQTYR